MKRIGIFGSTGSIGKNTIRIIREFPDKFRVIYLACGKNYRELIDQAKLLKPKMVAIYDENFVDIVKSELSSYGIKILSGNNGIRELAECKEVDLVVNAIVGFKGLEPTYICVKNGVNIALSNKESIVMAGEIITSIVKDKGINLHPIDSEHSAIWQCIIGEDKNFIKRIILTGSGGPFRQIQKECFANITPEQALKHPTWSMGKKITIDSATMMNKGLEVIEARWLFDIPAEKIDILIHPQSIVHSLVEFVDGSVKAQLGVPDMKLPIQFALSYPERFDKAWEKLNLENIGTLTFEQPDIEKFPCIRLAYESISIGGNAPAILNVANELAVYAFLDRKIKFNEIPVLIEKALKEIDIIKNPSIEDIFLTEKEVSKYINLLI